MLHNHETIKTVFAIGGIAACIAFVGISIYVAILVDRVNRDKSHPYEQEEE